MLIRSGASPEFMGPQTGDIISLLYFGTLSFNNLALKFRHSDSVQHFVAQYHLKDTIERDNALRLSICNISNQISKR